MRRAARVLVLAVLAAGCGGSKENPLIPPAGLPANSTPAGALARFEAAYEQQLRDDYRAMFTTDFSFRFSSEADPALAALFGANWGRALEDTAAWHLFDGFTSTQPPFEAFPPATAIAMTMVGPQILDDLLHADSTRHYRYVAVPRVDLEITVAGSPEPILYSIDSPHDLYLVRGDAAALSPDQPADSLHWYIHRWHDKAPPAAGFAAGRVSMQRRMAAKAVTWGSMKAHYAGTAVVPPVATDSTETPAALMQRFERTYEQRRLDAYGDLFTADFSFRFSIQADPALVAEYGTGWGVDDELASAGHLFAGFTSTEPPFDVFPPATAIAMTLVGTQFLDDASRPDSTRFYKYVAVPLVEMQITVASSGDPLVYEISAQHDFHLVRGDAAVLAAGQAADSLHWYIRRWDDRSPPPVGLQARPGLAGAMRILPARISTWGSVKAMYRR
jgi:hypothetical protein